MASDRRVLSFSMIHFYWPSETTKRSLWNPQRNQVIVDKAIKCSELFISNVYAYELQILSYKQVKRRIMTPSILEKMSHDL